MIVFTIMLQLTSIKCENKLVVLYCCYDGLYLCLYLELAAVTTIIIAKEHIPTHALVVAQGLESITCALEADAHLGIFPRAIDTVYDEHRGILGHVWRTYCAIHG